MNSVNLQRLTMGGWVTWGVEWDGEVLEGCAPFCCSVIQYEANGIWNYPMVIKLLSHYDYMSTLATIVEIETLVQRETE